MPIEIVEADPAWTAEFARLKAQWLPLAPPGAVFHHIGSTAVTAMPAKDVIDMQLTVPCLADVDVAAFEDAGLRLSQATADHCPAGLTLEPAELAKLLFKPRAGRAVNLHVREQHRFNQRYALLCRDYLRTHGVAARAYGVIKQRLARFFPDDEEAYYDIKDPVFDLIVEAAGEWARATGWQMPAGD